ncbi:protein-export chaperone SecB [Levilactobacillus yiduensis]|uniref:protein-export chaperone SecB n=1 Tax=Levilactobacillus yiduensis TaxID=2953880 RepID=UPI0021586559|nr:protein-export chaperone SecB [Levilactobacillus yiduensis]
MAVIQFEGYEVTQMHYEKNKNFKRPENGKLKIAPLFSVNVEEKNDNESAVLLSVSLEKGAPFNLQVSIEGLFKYNAEEDKSDFGKNNLFSTNAVAILFPYLRSCVSALTNLSNDAPALILPTMNIVELLKKQDMQG